MTQPQRWEPDRLMVAAVLSTPKASRRMQELSEADRAWLVAGLTEAGVTAQDIADRTHCSLRLIRSIRAEPITQMCVLWLEAERQAADELRVERSDHALTRCQLAEARAETARLRTERDQLIDAHMTGRIETFRKCGHPKVKYNVYRYRDVDYCRTCRRDWQANRRRALAAV